MLNSNAVLKGATAFLANLNKYPCPYVIEQEEREEFARILHPAVPSTRVAVQDVLVRFQHHRVRLEMLAAEVEADLQMFHQVDSEHQRLYLRRLAFWLKAKSQL